MKPYNLTLTLILAAGWLITCDMAANAQTPPAPPAKADLEGTIQPPIQPAEAPRVIPPAPAIPPAASTGQLSDEIVAWDGEQKEETVTNGTMEAHFKFSLTNVSPGEVTIFSVHTTCGCTTAHLPPMPWKLVPGTNGEIDVTMNLAGKSGTVIKMVTVSTDKGNKTLTVRTTIVQPPANGAAVGTPGPAPRIARSGRALKSVMNTHPS